MTEPPTILIIFLSKSKPRLDNSLFRSVLDIEPNNLPPVPDLADILSSNLSSFLTNLLASSITFFSLNSLCLMFSAKTFFEDGVASIASPCGIKKFLPYPFFNRN